VGPIGQTHIGKDASSPVAAVRLEEDFLPKHQIGRRLLGLMAVRLALLRAIDPAEADTFRVLVVKDFEDIAVKDGDDETMIIRVSDSRRGCQDGEEHTKGPYKQATVGTNRESHGGLAGRCIVGGLGTRAQAPRQRVSLISA